MTTVRAAAAEAPRTEAGTRERILDAAMRLFYDQGYEPTSLRAVAVAAGVHGGSVYHFFPTKADLVEAALERYIELLDLVIMAPARAAESDPLERVMRLLAGYRENLLATAFTGGCPIGSLALELAESQPRARALVVENFEAWRGAVAEILRDAALPRDIDASDVSAFVLTVMEGAVMQARSYRSIEPFDTCVRQLRRYLEITLWEGGQR